MATLPNNQQEQQQNNQGTSGAQVPITGTSGGPTGSGTGKGVGTNQAPQVQQNQAQNGNGYTDVSSYLNANQQGGTNLGNQIASNLTTGYNNTTNDINNAYNTAANQVNMGYTPENTQLIQQVAANPTAVVANPNQVSAFQGQLGDTYTGPTTWNDTTNATTGATNSGYGTLQGEVNQAQQNAALTTAPGGNNALIQQVEGQTANGSQSQGINALDTLLFQGNPNAVATAQTAAAPYANLGTYLNSQNTNFGTDVTNAQNAAQAASNDALNAINQDVTGLNTGLNTELTNAQNQTNAYNQALTAERPTIQAEQQALLNAQNTWLAPLGPILGTVQNDIGNAAQAQPWQQAIENEFNTPINAINANLNTWLNTNPQVNAPNIGNTATSQDYQTLEALQSLIGPNGTINSPLTSYNPNQAGTFTVPTLPTAPTSDASTMQYLSDLASLYSNPADNPFGQSSNNPQATPIQLAQYAQSELQNSGQQNNTDYVAALNRLLGGEVA